MAQDIISFSTTPANNTTIGTSISVAENCPIANWNNAVRELMANLATRLGSSFTLADSATPALGDQEEEYGTLNGTTTITAFGTPTTAAGKFGFEVVFAAARTLTHDATSLILPGGANITTAAGDIARFRHEGSGNWRCLWYTRASGAAVVASVDDLSVTAQKLAIKGNFQPYAQSSPNMTIALAEGTIQASTALTRVASQNTAAITAPSGNPRKDIVYIDAATGAVGVATGAEAASPSDPAIPAGKVAIARIRLATSTTSITNSLIDDLRSGGNRRVKSSAAAITLSASNTFAHGLPAAPDKFGAYIVMGASTELGYAQGDRYDISYSADLSSNARSVGLYANATNVVVNWGSSPIGIKSLSSGSFAAIDESKWTVVIWADL